MLRAGRSKVHVPDFTCALCVARPLTRISHRQLHLSNKAGDYNFSQQERKDPSLTPPRFQSLRSKSEKTLNAAATKWNLPEFSFGNRGSGGNNNIRNSVASFPIEERRRDTGYTGPAIVRPGDLQSARREPQPYKRPPFRKPFFGPRDEPTTHGQYEKPGSRKPSSDFYGMKRKYPQSGDDQQRFGRQPRGEVNNELRSPRLSEESQGMERENTRYGDMDRKPTPSRFTNYESGRIRTREKIEDPQYSRRKAGKERDRGRNRRFDAEESAILEDSGESAMTAKEARKAKKAKRKEKLKELIPIFLPQFISVEKLATMLNVRVERFAHQLKEMGFTETNNDHVLGSEEAGLIAGEFGYEPVVDRGEEVDLKPRPRTEDPSLLPTRPPIVTIMGHVDHGKTTLLDWLRKSSVAASEHGGITQHIGAFSVKMSSGKVITFLDTPGHAAFLSMRERGANVTDIVILVVAADDSVMPQTIEAIKHAKAANVPIIVAINKIDKPDSNVDKVKGDLARYGVEVEDIGGETQTVCVSGKTGQGMEELEEATIALGEILDHRAEIDGQIEGWVLEATTKKKGRVATVLVTRGTLKPGDIVVAGKTWTKVRSMTNEHGEEILLALPGTPVEIDGWRDQPEAGDLALSAKNEDRAKAVISYRIEKADRIKQAADMEAINTARRQLREREEIEEEIRREATERGEDPEKAVEEAAKKTLGELKAKTEELGLIVKADVSGSVEAVVDQVSALGNDEVKAKIIRSSFGAVSEFDIDHAAAAEAYILAFNLTTDPHIYQYARSKNVTIISDNVIYRLVDEVESRLSELLPLRITTTVIAEAEVLQVFQINIKKRIYKPVAGCRVKNGVIHRNGKVRVLRNKEIIFDGVLESLKNVQKDVDEMKKASDCGISFAGWGGFLPGDIIQEYEVIKQKRTL